MSTMKNMLMRRDELLEILRENRRQHREKFLAAQERYRTRVIEELDKMLAEARSGKKVERYVNLPEPQDYTSTYDRYIQMLEMCVDEDIEVTAGDFQKLVQDDWEWSENWKMSNATYGVE